MTKKLVPKTVTIGSDLKFYGDSSFRGVSGSSSGSSVSVTYEIPPGVSKEELESLVYGLKLDLDQTVLDMEVRRGSVPKRAASEMEDHLIDSYDEEEVQ